MQGFNDGDNSRQFKVSEIVFPHSYSQRWHVVARVVKITSSTKKTEKGESHPFGTIHLEGLNGDNGRIKCMIWCPAFHSTYPLLKVNGVYKFENANVSKNDPKFRDPNPAYLSISNKGMVIEVEDPSAAPAATENGLPRGNRNKRSRLDDDAAQAASSSSSVDYDSADVTYLTDMNKMLLLPPKNDGSKWIIQSCAVLREVLTYNWGYPKCKIRPQCDQEMQFVVDSKSWRCSKCETATKSDFIWHLEIKIRIYDGTEMVVTCDTLVAEKILGVNSSYVGNLVTNGHDQLLKELAEKAAFQHFIFEFFVQGGANKLTDRIEKLLPPTAEKSAFLFSKLITSSDDKVLELQKRIERIEQRMGPI